MLEYFILLLLATLTIVFVYIILWTPTVTRSADKETQMDNTIQIEDINKILKCYWTILKIYTRDFCNSV